MDPVSGTPFNDTDLGSFVNVSGGADSKPHSLDSRSFFFFTFFPVSVFSVFLWWCVGFGGLSLSMGRDGLKVVLMG